VIGKIFGVVGIFLSIPFAAIMVYIFQNFILTRLEARKARMKEVKTSPILENEDLLKK
jgi:predicted PurR-regulated permease PerM